MPSRNSRYWLVAAALCSSLLWAETAAAVERVLILEVMINGRHGGRVAEFIDRDGVLYGNPADLEALGLNVPPQLIAGAAPIPFSSLPNIRIQVDEARQVLLIVASDAALKPTQLGAGPRTRLTPLTKAQFGALLNYDSAITYSDKRMSGGAIVDLRLFGPYGVVESSALASVDPPSGQSAVTRLDTTFTYTQADKLRRWRAGDIVTGALPWTRAVRLGGVQVASDFALRPDLVTFPLPTISSSAAVPSTVNVMVDGIKLISKEVEPGPFAITTLPVVSGAGSVSVTLLDALGQPTLITMPFYASSALLTPGLASYSVEAGMVREDFGLVTDHYSGWAISQSSRFGITSWLTLESHAEATKGMAMAGGGATIVVGTFGTANVAAAASTGGGRRGGMISAGFQRVSQRLNFGVSGSFATAGFGDIAAIHGSPVPKLTLDANMGYELGRWGSLGLAYNRRSSRADGDAAQVELLTGSYNVSIAGFANFHASGTKNMRDEDAYGIGAGLSFPLGRMGHSSVEVSVDRGGVDRSASLLRNAQHPGDYGYRLRVSDGTAPRHTAEGEYIASWGRLTAGADHFSGQLAARAGARGAILLAGSQLFASERIDDSFAIVSTGGVAGVPVMSENRLVGRTNRNGKLLIPSLRSFQDNRLSIDSTSLPADVDVERTDLILRPADRSGVAADFGVRKINAALVTLHDKFGKDLPLGSIAKVEGANEQPIGHDGEAYLTGLKPNNRVQIDLPDGSHCSAQFKYAPVSGDIPLIGPLICS